MKYVPSFNDFNSNVANPDDVREHAAATAGMTIVRGTGDSAGAGAGSGSPGPVDLAEGESAAGPKPGPRSPAQVFADSLYESMRQT
jgi:hypothetical protein